MDNWRSSSDRPELTDELVQSEVNQGWVEPFDGSIEDAQTRWPTGVAIGRLALGIAISDSRDPRLLVDSSICGANSSCYLREHQALPTSKVFSAHLVGKVRWLSCQTLAFTGVHQTRPLALR